MMEDKDFEAEVAFSSQIEANLKEQIDVHKEIEKNQEKQIILYQKRVEELMDTVNKLLKIIDEMMEHRRHEQELQRIRSTEVGTSEN